MQPRPTLALVFGDQLDASYPQALGLDRERDTIAMVEIAGASREPMGSVMRTVVFLSAMRHHAAALERDGWRVDYTALTDEDNTHTFGAEIRRALDRHAPERVAAVMTGSHTLNATIRSACRDAGVGLDMIEDPHFLCTLDEFEHWAKGRRRLTLEYFYRTMRRRLGVLMDGDDPIGGKWNYDKDNRKSFRDAPAPPAVPEFEPDATTRRVIDDVRSRLPDLPGRLGRFIHPLTREQALGSLGSFIQHRLAKFGDYQDAMWTGEPTLFHGVLSVPLNLKLLNPRELCAAAIRAHEEGRAPLNSVEGFVRQIIGWREFIRGVYFHEGADYESRNALGAHGDLPRFYWDADTDMRCMRDAIEGVLDLGYSHHIARLMVTGNFALIAGVEPRQVNDWYLGMYADGVEWVTAPNTIGMALHADGAVVGTKPYAASGKYIQRMGNHCKHCPYSVSERSGEDACPFNVFYWDFLLRHEATFKHNNRMAMALKNLEHLGADERVEIRVSAESLRERFGVGPIDR